MSYVVARIDYGNPKGVIAGPMDREAAIAKANDVVRDLARGSAVDPHLFEEKSDVFACEGYAKHSTTAIEVHEAGTYDS